MKTLNYKGTEYKITKECMTNKENRNRMVIAENRTCHLFVIYPNGEVAKI